MKNINNKTNVAVSVVLCCYNSGETIGLVLQSLLTQKCSANNNYEIILVDNNCTDNTVVVAEEVYRNLNSLISLEIIRENRPGLNFARSAGILASRGQQVVFCDDDNIFEENYLFYVSTLFAENPELGCVGPGKVHAVDIELKRLPEKLRYFFQDKNIEGHFSPGGPDYVWANIPAGTGMAVRKNIAMEFCSKIDSGQFTSSDRTGKSLSSGGDTQIVYLSLSMGYSVGLSDTLGLFHVTTPKKMSRSYIEKMYFGVHSCHQAHVEAWPAHQEKYINEKLDSTLNILISHFTSYGHKSFRLGKYKHLIAKLGNRYGVLTIRNQKDMFLELVIKLMNLK